MEQLNPPAIHGEVVAGRAASVRKQLGMLASDIHGNTLDMAELLKEAKHKNFPKAWGFDGIIDFAATELGIKERKAMFLIRIVEVCEEVGVKRADYEKNPISHLREITTLNPKEWYHNPETHENEEMAEHIVRLLAEGPEMSREEVVIEVAKLKGMTGDNVMVTRSYRTTAGAWEYTIKRAIETVRKMLGSAGRDPDTGKAKEYSDGVCYEVICANFLSDPHIKHETEVPQDEVAVLGTKEVPTENEVESGPIRQSDNEPVGEPEDAQDTVR